MELKTLTRMNLSEEQKGEKEEERKTSILMLMMKMMDDEDDGRTMNEREKNNFHVPFFDAGLLVNTPFVSATNSCGCLTADRQNQPTPNVGGKTFALYCGRPDDPDTPTLYPS